MGERYGKGSWAVVTGASDGLGKLYALELAREGLNIVVMGRNKERTEAAAKFISDETGVKTMTLLFDFSKLNTEEDVAELKKLLDTIPENVSVLANNIGRMVYGTLDKIEAADINWYINININATTYMT